MEWIPTSERLPMEAEGSPMASEGITIVVTGHPVAKGRGRAYARPGGGIGIHTPQKTRRWEQDARDIARERMQGRPLFDGCLQIKVFVGFAISQSWPAWKKEAAFRKLIAPSSRPDLDNIVKAAKDAFNGVVWMDDSQIVQMEAMKFYSDHPGVTVVIKPLSVLSARTAKKADLGAI